MTAPELFRRAHIAYNKPSVDTTSKCLENIIRRGGCLLFLFYDENIAWPVRALFFLKLDRKQRTNNPFTDYSLTVFDYGRIVHVNRTNTRRTNE